MMNFEDLNISEEIKNAVADMGFNKMTPVQKMAIPDILRGLDVTAQAQTGSGKTVAFAIPIIENVFIDDKSPQAIVLCPTRELCLQVTGEIEKVASKIKKLKVLAVYGGQTIGKQTRVLKKGVHIIVGTPGRVIDHVERENLDLTGIERVVLDEADEMLDMGFRGDIERILDGARYRKQTLMFSATIPNEIRQIAENYQNSPEFIKVPNKRKNVPKITQHAFRTNHKYKFKDMTRLFVLYNVKSALIFSNTKKGVDFVYKNLKKEGFSVESLHGDMTQKVRDKVMNKFRNGNVGYLVATDVAARGLDITNLKFIINYDVPWTVDDYIHRIGRTARAGKSGYALSLVSKEDEGNFNKIKKEFKGKIHWEDIPNDDEISRIKNKRLYNEIKKSLNEDDLTEYVEFLKNNSSADVSMEEIAAALLKKVRES